MAKRLKVESNSGFLAAHAKHSELAKQRSELQDRLAKIPTGDTAVLLAANDLLAGRPSTVMDEPAILRRAIEILDKAIKAQESEIEKARDVAAREVRTSRKGERAAIINEIGAAMQRLKESFKAESEFQRVLADDGAGAVGGIGYPFKPCNLELGITQEYLIEQIDRWIADWKSDGFVYA